jgi:hypothetical protein
MGTAPPSLCNNRVLPSLWNHSSHRPSPCNRSRHQPSACSRHRRVQMRSRALLPTACSHRKMIPLFRRDLMKSSINCVNFPAMQRIGILVWRFLSKFMKDLFCLDVQCSPPPFRRVAVIDCGIVGRGYAADNDPDPT